MLRDVLGYMVLLFDAQVFEYRSLTLLPLIPRLTPRRAHRVAA